MTTSERVLEQIGRAEYREPDAWYRADYAVARRCIMLASEGVKVPWELAFCYYYGKHPAQLIPQIRNREWIIWTLNGCQGPEPDVWQESQPKKDTLGIVRPAHAGKAAA